MKYLRRIDSIVFIITQMVHKILFFSYQTGTNIFLHSSIFYAGKLIFDAGENSQNRFSQGLGIIMMVCAIIVVSYTQRHKAYFRKLLMDDAQVREKGEMIARTWNTFTKISERLACVSLIALSLFFDPAWTTAFIFLTLHFYARVLLTLELFGAA